MANNKTKIDMGHGFMKSIIRNQVDRDNYDKEVKSKKQEKPKFNQRPKKPNIDVYVPPTRQKKDEKNELFQLEFEDKEGDILTFIVYQDDKPHFVARKIGNEKQLTQPFIEALEERIKQEMEKLKNEQT
ncbi:UPF0561 protein C2orf68 homolog [Mytilus californianus]|uniref:UPF0561 protein C2orf68 homolog n=1 Tax=Mytilus californianus TaxID=6549 RepID=UPI002245BA3A|nr:UPF0561 protein C2orf68 homolog [Mytilus californianus]